MPRFESFALEMLESRVLLDASPAAAAAASASPPIDAHAAPPEAPGENAENPSALAADFAGHGEAWDGLFAGLEESMVPLAATASPERSADSTSLRALSSGPERPLLVLHGIGGSMPASADYSDWVMNRGYAPDQLFLDPVKGYYEALMETLRQNGYREGTDLWAANYDWRSAPGPTDGLIDGTLHNEPGSALERRWGSDLTAAQITDGDYDYGVDALGYWLLRASLEWALDQDDLRLPADVDLIAHSTGGLVMRAYVQSAAYGGVLPVTNDGGTLLLPNGQALPSGIKNPDGTTVTTSIQLPTVNRLVTFGVPMRGAPGPYLLSQDDWGSDSSYEYLSKIATRAYVNYQGGADIEGPNGQTIQGFQPGDEPLNPKEFIALYCPTFRALTATYPFIDDSMVAQFFNTSNEANSLVLDLNDGLDFYYEESEIVNGAVAKGAETYHPAGYVDRIGGEVTVVYNGTVRTSNTLLLHSGPSHFEEMSDRKGDFGVTHFYNNGQSAPEENEVWFTEDVAEGFSKESTLGDGSVPERSAIGIYRGVGVSNLGFIFNPSKVRLAPMQEQASTHTGMLLQEEGLRAALDALGFDESASVHLVEELSGVALVTSYLGRDAFLTTDPFRHDAPPDFDFGPLSMPGAQAQAPFVLPTLSEAQIEEFAAVLDALRQNVIAGLTSAAELSEQIPLLGAAVGDAIDLAAGEAAMRLVEAAGAIRALPGGSTLEALAEQLEFYGLLAENMAIIVAETYVEFLVNLAVHVTNGMLVSLGDAAATAGELAAALIDEVVETTNFLQMEARIRIETTGAQSAGVTQYGAVAGLTAQELDASGTAQLGSEPAVTYNESALEIEAYVTQNLMDPNPEDGMVTVDEMTSQTGAEQSAIGKHGRGRIAIRTDTADERVVYATTTEPFGRDPDVFIDSINFALIKEKFRQMLDQLALLGDAIQDPHVQMALHIPLPFLDDPQNNTLDELLTEDKTGFGLDEFFAIVDILQEYCDDVQEPNLADFLDRVMRHFRNSGGDGPHAHGPFSISGGFDATGVGFRLIFKADLSRSQHLLLTEEGLGAEADVLGLDFSIPATGTVSFSTEFSIGMDLQGLLSVPSTGLSTSQVTLDFNKLALGFDLEVPDIDASMSLGFLQASIVDGTATMNLVVDAAINGNNPASLAQLQSSPGAVWLSFTPGPRAALDVRLPLTASVGGVSLTAECSPVITITDSNLFDSQAPQVATSDFECLSGFCSMTPEQALVMLKSLGDWLAQFRDSPIFDATAPLTSGATLGSVFDVAKAFTDKVYYQLAVREIAALGTQTETVMNQGRLAGSATFELRLDNGPPATVSVPAIETATNESLEDLVADFNAALSVAGIGASVEAAINGRGRLSLRIKKESSVEELSMTVPDADGSASTPNEDPMIAELGFSETQYSIETPDFSNIEEFSDDISSALARAGIPLEVNLRWDPSAQEARMDVSYSSTVKTSASFDFDPDLGFGPLLEASASGAITLSASLNAGFTLGFDMKPKETPRLQTGGLVPPPSTGRITADAAFTLKLGSDRHDLMLLAANTSANNSLAELAADLNALFVTNGISERVAAEVSMNTIVLKVPDAKLGQVESIQVLGAEDSTFFTEIGFANGDADCGTSVGLFVENVTLNGALSISASELEASLRVGVFSVSVSDGYAIGSGSFDLALEAPDGDIRFNLDELFAEAPGFGGLLKVAPTLEANIDVRLPNLQIEPDLFEIFAAEEIRIYIPDIHHPEYNAESFDPALNPRGLFITLPTFGGLSNFGCLTYLDILQNLSTLADQLKELQGFGFLDKNIPLLNLSISDILDYAGNIAEMVEGLAAGSGDTIETLERDIEDFLNVSNRRLIDLTVEDYTPAALARSGGGPATATFNPSGASNAIKFESKANHAQYEGAVIEFIDDGRYAGTVDDAVVEWSEANKRLRIYYHAGFTTASTVVSRVKASAAAPIDANLDSSLENGGTGAISITALKFSLHYNLAYGSFHSLDLGLDDLIEMLDPNDPALAALGGVSGIVQLEANGSLNVTASADLLIEFGIDVSNPCAWVPFLYDTTNLTLAAAIRGADIDLTASIGPLGVFGKDGSVTVDRDGDPTTAGEGEDATFTIGIADNDHDGRHYFRDGLSFLSDVSVELEAGAGAEITWCFPTPDLPLGTTDDTDGNGFPDNTMVLRIPDLETLFNFGKKFVDLGGGQFEVVLPSLGPNNDLRLTTFDPAIAGHKVRLVNLAAGLPRVEITTDSLLIHVDSGNTDLSMLLGLSTPQFTISVSAGTEASGTNNGSGKVSASVDLAVPNFLLFLNAFNACDLITNAPLLLDGLDAILGIIQDGLRSEVLSRNLPLVGTQLAKAGNFIQDFRHGLLADIRARLAAAGDPLQLVQDAIWNALGKPGLNILDASIGSAAEVPVICQMGADGQMEILFDLQLGKTIALVDTSADPIAADLGIPGLGLEIDGNVTVEVGWSFRFSFGISSSDGFFLNTNLTEPELRIHFSAAIPGLAVSGNLFFLELKVSDEADGKDANGNPRAVTAFTGEFTVDLVDPNQSEDGRISFSQMSGGGFDVGDFFVVSLDACADVHLDLEVSFGDDARFPRLLAEFDLAWCWDPLDGESSGGDLQFGFHNLQIDLGHFISKFIIPILDEIQAVTKPLDPIIDILTARLPIFSDLAGEPLTLLDLAEAAGLLKPGTVKFIESLGIIADLANQASVFNGKTILINLGGFDLEKNPLGNIDPFAPLSKYEIKPEEMTADSDAKGFLGALKDLGFAFPFLSLSELYNLLTGEPVSLVEYRMDVLEFEAKISGKMPIFPPLYIIFGGKIEAKIDLTFGFDTTGIQKYSASSDKNVADILEGFYVKDVDDYGNEITELQLTGGLFAGAAIDLLVAEVGVTGGIFAEINFDLRDLDGDGRVRATEIAANAEGGPLCIFEVMGRLYVALDAFLEVHLLILDVDKEWRFGEITLLEFEIDCPMPVLASFDTNGDGAESPSEQGAGVLVLHQGDYAALRKYGNTADGNEHFTVRGATELSDGAQSVEVSYGGHKQTFSGVKSILAKAGKGNDTVDLTGVLVPAEVHAGEGNDLIKAARGGGTYYGDAGNDRISAEEASDDFSGGTETFYGGAGNDELKGFEGNDFLYGDDGEDELFGGDGADALDGGNGNDWLWGEIGHDVLNGGDGSDFLAGDDGADKLTGGEGDDTLEGGNDDDELTGGLGNDSIEGGAGDDVLIGDEGAIVSLLKVTGITGAGNDVLAGGAGNDTLIGAGGNDALYGGNHVTAGITSAVGVTYRVVGLNLEAEPDGADFLDGGEGDDVIIADDGHSGQSSTFPGAEIGNLVWLDLNENGIQDAGEPGLPGVRVEIYRSSDNVRVGLAATDSSGSYRFAGLGANDYYLQIAAPAGTSFTEPAASGSDSGTDSDFTPLSGLLTGVTDSFHLNVGEKRTDLDAGIIGGTPTVSIADTSVLEGDSGVTHLVFTVSLSSASSQVVTVNYKTGPDSDATTENALAGFDYASTEYTLVFAPGELSKQILVPVFGDFKDELNEVVQVTLADAFQYTTSIRITDGSGLGTILDDDEAPVAVISDSSVDEPDGAATASIIFTVTLSNPSWQTLKIDWVLRQVADPDGGLAMNAAVAGADYTDGSGTLTFTEEVTSQTFAVSIKGDALDEYDEELLAVLSPTPGSPADGLVIQDDAGTGTIVDNDASPFVTIRNPDPSPIVEGHAGNKPAPLTIGLSAVSGRAVTVSWNTARGTAIDSPSLAETADFVDTFETLTFAPGEISKTVHAFVIGDTTRESREHFFANLLTAVNGEIGATSAHPNHAVIHIQDDESGDQGPWHVQFSDATYRVAEGGTAVITLVRAGGSSHPVAVYWISGGSASPGSDYDAALNPAARGGDRGIVHFGPGETIKTFEIATFDNANSAGESIYEGDETILLELANPQGGPVRGAIKSATLTIIEDDPEPVITISDAPGAAHFALEKNSSGAVGSLVFTVSVTGATSQEVQVSYRSISGAAVAEQDFVTKAGTLTFNESTSYAPQTITIDLKDDALAEDYEDLYVVLSDPVNATIGDDPLDSDATGGEDSNDRGYGLILDDDLASASGRVFFDADANGYRDAETDYGYAGVTVTWTNALDPAAIYVGVTSADGLYTLSLPLGDYSVTVEETDLPSGASPTGHVLPRAFSFAASGATLDLGYALPSATDLPSTSSGSSSTGSNDTAYGGSGSDTLDGGAGDDRLVGGHWLGPAGSCDGAAYDIELLETKSGSVRTLIDIDPAKLPPLSRIEGRVWLDTNGDNTENAATGTEAGLANVQVNLYDTDWALIATAYTDNSGNYSFANLVAFDYRVQILPPGGFSVVAKGVGTAARNSDIDAVTGLTDAIAVAAGSTVSNIDAGLRLLGGGAPPWNVSFSQSVYSVRESDGFALISLTGSGDALHPVAVYYTADGTASAAVDYTAIRNVLRIDRGESAAYFLVPIVLDEDDSEGYETVLLHLQNPQGGPVRGAQPAAVLLLFDNPCADDDDIEGGEGNDLLLGDFGYVKADSTALLLGGMGNDLLSGGEGDDLLYGGGGNDALEGGTGNDRLDGGSENDLYVFDTDEVLGSDQIAEADGVLGGADTLDFSTTGLSVVIDLADATLELSNHGLAVLSLQFPANRIENVYAGSGNDTLIGSDFANILRGNSGNDVLEGRGGNDDLDGGADNDAYLFDADNSLGSDRIFESSNRDADTIDFAGTTAQAVALNLGSSASQIVAPTLTLTISTAPMISFIGSFHVALVLFNPFTGEVVASDVSTGIENLYGSSTAPGSGTQDMLTGNSRDNVIWGREGNDHLDGGSAGYDALREERAGDWQLAATSLMNVATGETDTFAAGAFDEISLTGDDNPNELDASSFSGLVRLDGAGGDDTLIGGSGTNYLTGGPGKDSIDGALGYDILTESRDSDMILTPVTLVIGAETDIFIGTIEEVDLTGGPGANTLNASAYGGIAKLHGAAGPDLLLGGSGSDVLEGGEGDDILAGGLGDDTYLFDADGALGADQLSEAAGEGRDLLDFSPTDSAGVIANLGITSMQAVNSSLQIRLSSAIDFEDLRGGASDDTLIGNDNANLIDGLDGSDRITGALGEDTLSGGGGLNGAGVAFADTLVETRNALLMTLSGSALSFGVAVEDALTGFERAELTGGFLGNRIDASLFPGPVVLKGEGGNDTLLGGSFGDTLAGGAGDDDLRGGTGDDLYLFDSDSALGADLLTDAGGIDWIDLSGTTSVASSISLQNTAAQAINPNLILTLAAGDQIENLRGGALGDRLTGNALANTIEGGFGDDRIAGLEGNDLLLGGEDDDSYIFGLLPAGSLGTDTVLEDVGSGGLDTLEFNGTAATSAVISLAVGAEQSVHASLKLLLIRSSSIENVAGTEGADRITGNSLDNRLEGRGGNDTIFGGLGNDAYVFDADSTLGADTLAEDAVEGGIDTLDFSATTAGIGTAASPLALNVAAAQSANASLTLALGSASAFENVLGGAGDDFITGNDRDNVLAGGAGNDTLNGRPGNDVLEGGSGNDNLSGGRGDDQYLLAESASGSDLLVEAAGEGSDTVDFSQVATQAITFGLNLSTAQNLWTGLAVTLSGTAVFENLAGGALDDVLTGNNQPNSIAGGTGADRLAGRGGADSLAGGAGDDTYEFGASTGDDLIAESFGEGTDTLDFAATNRELTIAWGEIAQISFVDSAGETHIVSHLSDQVEKLIGTGAADNLVVAPSNVAAFDFTGGAGTDTLTFVTGGGAAIQSAGRIELPGYMPVTFRGFESVTVTEEAP